MDSGMKCALLAGLPNQTLELMSTLSTLTSYDAQTVLFHEGEPATVFYIVMRGAVAVEANGFGSRTVLQNLGRGDVLGWSWLFEPYAWQFDARAVKPTRALRVDGERLRLECERDQALALEMYKRFSQLIVRCLQACRHQMQDLNGSRQHVAVAADAVQGLRGAGR